MPYQQAVQPPKSLVPGVGRGVSADTPTGKTAPVGGTTQDHRRPAARGRGHGSCSVSHPRGAPGMASMPPQCQEGGLPSGSMPSGRSLPPPPPPAVPERTQPQWRGKKRSALLDPARLAANYHSSGWRKDLKHILKVYYKFNVDYFMEEDWHPVKEQFFNLFLQHKKGSLGGQGGPSTQLYGLRPGPLLSGHWPPFGQLKELHWVDQEGELLSWGSSSTGSPPGMPTPGGSPLAQMAPVGSQ